MVTRKGSIYWVDFSPGKGSEPMGRRPGLVVQNDILNNSKINTVIMLAITSPAHVCNNFVLFLKVYIRAWKDLNLRPFP